jgi:NAD(P)-dependent dehydrogenase (short-subunit alcohol dehydrogenase family)
MSRRRYGAANGAGTKKLRGGSRSAFMERRLALTPLRRIGEPHEIAGAAVLLASRAGAFITGHNLIIDGGTTISDGN